MADLEVMIMPVNRPMPEPIKYRATSLMKSFEEGDHVKVIQVRCQSAHCTLRNRTKNSVMHGFLCRGGTRTSRA